MRSGSLKAQKQEPITLPEQEVCVCVCGGGTMSRLTHEAGLKNKATTVSQCLLVYPLFL